jgi:transcriptional regulator with XRE-family HTH domain
VNAADKTTVPGKIPHPIDKYVGTRIRTRRLMLGMTQEKLAKALGLGTQQIRNYEQGSTSVMPHRLLQLAEALHVPSAAFFLEGAPFAKHSRYASNSSPVHFLRNFPTAVDDYAFLRNYLRIKSDEVRRALAAITDALADDHC